MAKKMPSNQKPAKLIFNPHAGEKRRLIAPLQAVTLEQIEDLLTQYQIPYLLCPTKAPGHATQIAQNAVKNGDSLILACGGDGTVSETASGLIGSSVVLGIIPHGSYMNIARMLSVPTDIEKAIELIKIGRIAQIDAASVTKLEGEKLPQPYYFFENAGMGLEAQVMHWSHDFGRHPITVSYQIIKDIFAYYQIKSRLKLDNNQEFSLRASLISISNGPYTGTALRWAPKAKLNDHCLTVTVNHMSRLELIRYFLYLFFQQKYSSNKINTYQAKKVTVYTPRPHLIHADAQTLGTTPSEFQIIPNALSVICGFPPPDQPSALLKSTIINP